MDSLRFPIAGHMGGFHLLRDTKAPWLVFHEFPFLKLTVSPIPSNPLHCEHVSQQRLGNPTIRLDHHVCRNGFRPHSHLIIARDGTGDGEGSFYRG
jgi:hypothetical protein